jgi:Domain of unknown function (DUF6265)
MQSEYFFLLSIGFMLTVHTAINAQSGDDFPALYSLAGTWKMETAKGILYESWEKLNDSTLKSRSYKVMDKDTVWLEQVKLVKREGKISYIPVVQRQNNNEPVAFVLKKIENNIYIFENAAHDFPQRIIYTLPQNNLLHAWIEGEVNGQVKRIDYRYSKVISN